MTEKEIKNQASKDLKELERLIKKEKPDFDVLYSNLPSYNSFKRFIYSSKTRGILEFTYGDMTLKILIKCGIIELDTNIKLWKHNEDGFIGNFTKKTLLMESSNELD